MDIPVVIDGFKSRVISLRPRGLFSLGPKLLLDGEPMRRTGYGYVIHDDSNQEVEFRIKHRFWDPVPDLMVGDQRIELLPPFKTHEHLWVCLSILMIAFGGLLGGACAGLAIGFNYNVFRRVQHPVLKYVLTGLITLCALLLYLAICLVLIHGFGIGRRG